MSWYLVTVIHHGRYREVTRKRLTIVTCIVDNSTMVRRYCSILIATWSVWGMPALCVGGVLEHPCAPERKQCQDTDASKCLHEEPGCPHDGDCGHESDCESDPCATTVIGRERSSKDDPLVSLDVVAIAQWTEHSAQALRSTPTRYSIATDNVQFHTHPSDIPLLI